MGFIPSTAILTVRRVRWVMCMAKRYCRDGPHSVPLLAALIGEALPPYAGLRGARVFDQWGRIDGPNGPPLLHAIHRDLCRLGMDGVNGDKKWIRQLALLDKAEVLRFRRRAEETS